MSHLIGSSFCIASSVQENTHEKDIESVSDNHTVSNVIYFLILNKKHSLFHL